MFRTKPPLAAVLLSLALLGTGTADALALQIGQRPADQYLRAMDSPRRVENLMAEEIVEALNLQPGDVVADIGSGAGAFTVPMAQAVGPSGTVYAVDIDQEMIDFVVNRAEETGLDNVEGVLGEFNDPLLPRSDVDVAFFHRTLHMIERRQAYLNATAEYMAPDGKIVVVERDEEAVRNWMWMDPDHVDSWMAALSFYPAQRVEGFDDRWFTIYQRPYGDSMLPGAGR